MSGIKKRTIFVDVHNKDVYSTADSMTTRESFHKFWDWALVQTEIGPMAEPFQVGLKYPHQTCLAQDYDPEDEMARVDEIKVSENDPSLLGGSGEDRALIGGILMTRVGR